MSNLDLAVSQPPGRKLTFEPGESAARKRKRKRSQNQKESSSSEFGDSDLEKYFAPSVTLPQSDDRASVDRINPAEEDAVTEGTIDGLGTDFEFSGYDLGDIERSPAYSSAVHGTLEDESGFLMNSEDKQSPLVSQTPAIQSSALPISENKGGFQQNLHSSDETIERDDIVKRLKVNDIPVEKNIDQSLLEEFGDIVNFTGI